MRKMGHISILLVILMLTGSPGLKRSNLFADITNFSGEKNTIEALSLLTGDYYNNSDAKLNNMAIRLRIVENFIMIAEGGEIRGNQYCLVNDIRKEGNIYRIVCSKSDLPEKFSSLIKSDARNLNFLFLIEEDIGKIILKLTLNEKEGKVFRK